MAGNKKIKKVAVLMGGPSSEHEVSLNTGENVLKYLNVNKFEGIKVKINKNGKWTLKNKIVDPKTALEKIDIVFNALHGEFGEDGRVQALLEFYKKPYTGSGILSSALAINKAKSRQLFRSVGLSTPRSILIRKGEGYQTTLNFFITRITNFPVVVKPNSRGSSVGVSIVSERQHLIDAIDAAFGYDDEVLLEEYIQGMEITVSVLDGYKKKKYFALPPTHILPAEFYGFFSYDAKYLPGASREITPAPLTGDLMDRAQDAALKAHNILGCKGYSRTDMMIKDNIIYVLELNTLPGLTNTSLLPQQAQVAGLGFSKLLDLILDSGS
jgi:D-alanine--D-alanine ligase